MKISKIFLPFQLALEAVTTLINAAFNRNPLPSLIPVRVKENNKYAMIKSREAERRYNQRLN